MMHIPGLNELTTLGLFHKWYKRDLKPRISSYLFHLQHKPDLDSYSNEPDTTQEDLKPTFDPMAHGESGCLLNKHIHAANTLLSSYIPGKIIQAINFIKYHLDVAWLIIGFSINFCCWHICVRWMVRFIKRKGTDKSSSSSSSSQPPSSSSSIQSIIHHPCRGCKVYVWYHASVAL